MSVPEPVFNHAKAQAYLSGMRFAEYVAKVLSDAGPHLLNRLPAPRVTVPDSSTSEAVDG